MDCRRVGGVIWSLRLDPVGRNGTRSTPDPQVVESTGEDSQLGPEYRLLFTGGEVRDDRWETTGEER